MMLISAFAERIDRAVHLCGGCSREKPPWVYTTVPGALKLAYERAAWLRYLRHHCPRWRWW